MSKIEKDFEMFLITPEVEESGLRSGLVECLASWAARDEEIPTNVWINKRNNWERISF